MNSGIYCIHNIVNGKRYIGQSVNIELRRQNHFSSLRCGVHQNSHLQQSFEKYGEASFEFCILEKVSEEMLDIREQAWIGYYRSIERGFGYNQESGGNLNHHHSDETIRKMSESQKGKIISSESRRKMSEAQKGKRLPLAQRKKMSETHKGRPWTEARRKANKRQFFSAERCRKISEANRSRGPVSNETRRRLSEAHKGKIMPEETRRKISEANKGKHTTLRGCALSVEHRHKIGLGLKKAYVEKRR